MPARTVCLALLVAACASACILPDFGVGDRDGATDATSLPPDVPTTGSPDAGPDATLDAYPQDTGTGSDIGRTDVFIDSSPVEAGGDLDGGTKDTTCPGFPDMIKLPKGFCIDKTEVSRKSYDDWLKTSPDAGAQDEDCRTLNNSLPPWCDPPNDPSGTLPVVCVDFCDAKAYCKGVGKRLCGKIGGGAVADPQTEYNRVDVSEWYYACSSGGMLSFGYGDKRIDGVCNEGVTDGGLAAVEGRPDCGSPYAAFAGATQLVGNAMEWENACDGTTCYARGGSFSSSLVPGSCAYHEPLFGARDQSALAGRRDIGIRCCADPQ